MTVEQIINKVRWSLDEEKGYEDYESGYMDNIIKGKIGDALRWLSIYCDASLLRGSEGFIGEKTGSGSVDLGSDCMRVIRVKGSDWSRAILQPVKEDSEEYMMQCDSNYPEAAATKQRPLAVIVEGRTTQILGFPTSSELTVNYIKTPSIAITNNAVEVPTLAESAFVYYLSYLVMIAFGEGGKAQLMLNTAKMHAGISDKT